MRATLLAAVTAVTALSVAACAHQAAQSGAETQTQQQAETGAEQHEHAPENEGELVGPPQVAWKDMTREQKGHWMKAKVMPAMKPLFQTFDPKDYGTEFTCASCHGKNARAREFKMPNPDLFVLPATEEAFKPVMEQKPEWVKFMAEQVTPKMAELLGTHPFNPQKPAEGGYSCEGCHTMEGGGAHGG